MSVKKRLLSRLRPYRQLIFAAALCAVIVAGADVGVSWLIKGFETAMKGKHPSLIWGIAGVYVLIHIPRGIARYWQSYWVAKATNKVATDLRDEIYAHIQRMSLSFFERNKTGHLMSRITYDVGLIQNGSGHVVDALTDPVKLLGCISVMFYVSWKLALVILVFVPILSLVINRVGRRLRKLTITLQSKLANLTAILEETIAGVRIVKSFVMEGHEIKRFKQQNEASLEYALKSARRNAAIEPIVELISSIGVAAIIIVGGSLVATGELTVGQLFQFAFLGFHASSSGKKIARLSMVYQQTMAGLERVFEVLDEEPELIDKPEARVLDRVEGSVKFEDVSFRYQSGPIVLDHISFEIAPGEVIAVVGPSGAGKSTIANLVPRFYDVSGGAVLVDGNDIRDVTAKSLRRQIGIVPQETILFGGTVRENIAYGKIDASDEEIVAAAKAANAHRFIEAFEEGYDTVIGERGVRLSGGERQRISIARALLKDPRILILDEATSSLDADSEKVVQEALDVLMQGRSTLVIAHRLSTITKANKILVLANGKIVEMGTFDELVSRGGLFSQLYQTQFRTSEACEVTT